jgi:hypothetical protein
MNLEALHVIVAVLRARLARLYTDDAGFTEHVILLAVLAAAALVVGGIISAKVVSKAQSIPLN